MSIFTGDPAGDDDIFEPSDHCNTGSVTTSQVYLHHPPTPSIPDLLAESVTFTWTTSTHSISTAIITNRDATDNTMLQAITGVM